MHLKNSVRHEIYEFSVDHLEETFQNYHFNNSYQDYMMWTTETYSRKLKQRENWLEGFALTQTSEETQGPRMRKSKNIWCFRSCDHSYLTVLSTCHHKYESALSLSSVLGHWSEIHSPRKGNWIGLIWVPCPLFGFRRQASWI